MRVLRICLHYDRRRLHDEIVVSPVGGEDLNFPSSGFFSLQRPTRHTQLPDAQPFSCLLLWRQHNACGAQSGSAS